MPTDLETSYGKTRSNPQRDLDEPAGVFRLPIAGVALAS